MTRKGESEPTKLTVIDEELCKMLNVPCHPTEWVCWWYDIIGLHLACGNDWEFIKAQFANPDPDDQVGQGLAKIAAYLEANFDKDAWYQVGR